MYYCDDLTGAWNTMRDNIMKQYAKADVQLTEGMMMNEQFGGINFRDAQEAWINDFREEAAKEERDRKLELAKELLAEFGNLNGDDVLKFKKTYDKNGKSYTYVAIYIVATKLWYLTGKSEAPCYTTASLIEFLVKGESATDLVWLNEGGAVL